MSILNALIECSIDCPSLCNWPINVHCPQYLPQCMLYEIGFDLTKWHIEGLLLRRMYFLRQIYVLESLNTWILESTNGTLSGSCEPGALEWNLRFMYVRGYISHTYLKSAYDYGQGALGFNKKSRKLKLSGKLFGCLLNTWIQSSKNPTN